MRRKHQPISPQPSKPSMALLTLSTSMLPSINQKNRPATDGERVWMYTTREYRAAIKQMRKDVQIGVAAARWKTSPEDRYIILADLPFLLYPGETPTTLKRDRDTDNPWKPMQDVLGYRHRAIYNDSQVEEYCPTRRWIRDPRDLLATITIARVHQDDFALFPVRDFFDQWARTWYTTTWVTQT